MHKKSKKLEIPKISDEEIAALTHACRMAFGNPAADEWFDKVMDEVDRIQKLRHELDKKLPEN